MNGPKIFKNDAQLSPQELADWANKIHNTLACGKGNPYTKEMFVPNDSKENQYRLGGYMCDCGCNEGTVGKPSKGEFELFSYKQLVSEGLYKPYMICKKCGCISHL